ncbi:unnamed protein product [marine sediment metagenome]|uniref:Uncharacterized protein n=1 Tax=marine sediment metagenome TaxID=412755 RepID=X1S3U5_9ZZZZ
MTTANRVRINQFDKVMTAFKRMQTVDEAAKKVAEEIAKEREKEEAG